MGDYFVGFGDPKVFSSQGFEENISDTRYFNLHNVCFGAWYLIHAVAAMGQYYTLLDIFNVFRHRFVCPKCRLHISEFMTSRDNGFPPSSSLTKLELFAWSVNFHNLVNIRLKKGIFSSSQAAKLWIDITAATRAAQISSKDIEPLLMSAVTIREKRRDAQQQEEHPLEGETSQLENIMYTPYLLAANGYLTAAKIIVEDLLTAGATSGSCLLGNFISLSPREALNKLCELAGEKDEYDTEKLFIELTLVADLDGRRAVKKYPQP
jgi:hypothetical protein